MADDEQRMRDVLSGRLNGADAADPPVGGRPGGTGPARPAPAPAGNSGGATEPLVQLGLNALARAHAFDYFADGHRGAAIVAANLLCVNNRLDANCTARIAELVQVNWARTPLCEDLPPGEIDGDAVECIGAALLDGAETLRQVGHNVIFAMLAVKALGLLPAAATAERVEGIVRLIRSFTPWRDVDPDADVAPPAFADTRAASRFVLREALDAVQRFVAFGQGYAGHMLTFGQALIELARMGHETWAEACRPAFRKYVTVTRLGPEAGAKRYADHPPTDLRPTDAAYWYQRGDNSLGIGHVFKYPYSYYELLAQADDPSLAQEWDAKAYHVF